MKRAMTQFHVILKSYLVNTKLAFSIVECISICSDSGSGSE